MRGERQPIQVRPQAMLEARDLPKCEISDFLQERIDNALSSELIQRSKQEGVPPDQVSIILRCKRIQVHVASCVSLHNMVFDITHTRLLSYVIFFKQVDHIYALLFPPFPPPPLPHLNSNLLKMVLIFFARNADMVVGNAACDSQGAHHQGHQQCQQEDGGEASFP